MTKRILTFERITRETTCVEVDLADNVPESHVQLWANSGINFRSPLDLPVDQSPAQRTKEQSKWKLVHADPALADEPTPTHYRIPKREAAPQIEKPKRGRKPKRGS